MVCWKRSLAETAPAQVPPVLEDDSLEHDLLRLLWVLVVCHHYQPMQSFRHQSPLVSTLVSGCHLPAAGFSREWHGRGHSFAQFPSTRWVPEETLSRCRKAWNQRRPLTARHRPPASHWPAHWAAVAALVVLAERLGRAYPDVEARAPSAPVLALLEKSFELLEKRYVLLETQTGAFRQHPRNQYPVAAMAGCWMGAYLQAERRAPWCGCPHQLCRARSPSVVSVGPLWDLHS